MITKDLIVSAIKGGLTPADIVELVQAAVNDIELEKQNNIRRKALMDGMMTYVGRDHDLWNHVDPWDVLETLEDVLTNLMDDTCDVDNCTEQNCSCEGNCSCEPKIVGKIKSYDENGKSVVRNITADEANEVLAGFLGSLGLR